MTNGESKDYKFGIKNQWRRWLWNRIEERLTVPAREAVVLYLAGQDDLDRYVALRHGFKDHNLIAIDRSEKVVRTLRNSGVVSMQGEFMDAICTWPANRPVHAIVGDFCCGLESKMWKRIMGLMLLTHVRPAVYAFNFLRGRDQSSNGIRASILESIGKSRDVIPELKALAEAKHRGMIVACDIVSTMISVMVEGRYEFTTDEKGETQMVNNPNFDRGKMNLEFVHWLSEYIIERSSFSPYSYKSSGQVFDSCVLRNPVHAYFEALHKIGFPADRLWRSIQNQQREIWKHDPGRKKAIAALAIRTMRINAAALR